MVVGVLDPIAMSRAERQGNTLERWPWPAHTHSHTYPYGQFIECSKVYLCCMSFGLWGKPEHPEETHGNTRRTCKLPTKLPPGLAGTQTEDLFAVRQHATESPIANIFDLKQHLGD